MKGQPSCKAKGRRTNLTTVAPTRRLPRRLQPCAWPMPLRREPRQGVAQERRFQSSTCAGQVATICHHSSFAPSRANADAIDATRTTQCT